MKVAKLAADFGSIVILPAVVSALMYGRLDEEQPVKSAVRETALYGAGFFPIFRDVAIAAWNYADPDTQFFGYRASPAAGALEAIAKLPGAGN